jgi:hypothetical protein
VQPKWYVSNCESDLHADQEKPGPRGLANVSRAGYLCPWASEHSGVSEGSIRHRGHRCGRLTRKGRDEARHGFTLAGEQFSSNAASGVKTPRRRRAGALPQVDTDRRSSRPSDAWSFIAGRSVSDDRVVTVLNPAHWTKSVAQLAKVLRSPSGAPTRIPDPSGQVIDPLTVHNPAYWGDHAAELDSALRRATETSTAQPTPDSGVGAAPPGVERLTLTVEGRPQCWVSAAPSHTKQSTGGRSHRYESAAGFSCLGRLSNDS